MIYAVIDTNVLVSAFITHNSLSPTAKVVRLMLDGEFTPLYETGIIEEYQEVLHRAKFTIRGSLISISLFFCSYISFRLQSYTLILKFLQCPNSNVTRSPSSNISFIVFSSIFIFRLLSYKLFWNSTLHIFETKYLSLRIAVDHQNRPSDLPVIYRHGLDFYA